ncbi:MAG TPA: ATP-binding cassette domain-containing protein [Bacteroidia bacterium]|jgi:phospholipid/cholesterol/gamma-HCH transport system ATP-binding protein|nr:ATP-binding cassette domain-containing protein [Bacteroidia bacterium]
MIELKHINKTFGTRQVTKDFSGTFEQGKTNLIIGESGSGKTVLLKCMVGLTMVDSGQILYNGRDYLKMTVNEKQNLRKEIGMLFQGGALFDSKTVEENVTFPLSMFTKMTEEEKKERANFCLSRVNLKNVNNLYPSEISGGMKKRVAIARAIAPNPKYLFCDEPNSGLDPKTSIVIDKLIADLTQEFNMTTVVITHDMNSVMEIGDKVVFIYNQQKWWEGDKNTILHTDNKELQDFIYVSKFLKELHSRQQQK